MNEINCNRLRHLYDDEKHSPDAIAIEFGVTGRTIRSRMKDCNICRRGPTHLRTAKSAYWNKGLSHEGWKKPSSGQPRIPHNKGLGAKAFKCLVCGNDVTDKPYRRKMFCGEACRNKAKGSDHWNYSGTESRNNQVRRHWAEYRAMKKAVHSRDKRCVICEVSSGLIVHHLKPWATSIDTRFDAANCISLCRKCHKEVHDVCGWRTYTYAKFLENYVCTATNTWKRSAIASW